MLKNDKILNDSNHTDNLQENLKLEETKSLFPMDGN